MDYNALILPPLAVIQTGKHFPLSANDCEKLAANTAFAGQVLRYCRLLAPFLPPPPQSRGLKGGSAEHPGLTEGAVWIWAVCLYRLGSAGKETPAAYSFQRRITRRQSTELAFPLPWYTNKRLKCNYRLYNQCEEKGCVVIDVIFYKYSGCLRKGKNMFSKEIL